MAQIMVNPGTVRDTGRRIKISNRQSNDYLDQIAASIGRLRGSSNGWDSDAAQAFFVKFDELKSRIERHKPIIDSYAAHLEKAAAEYEASDDFARTQADTINTKRGN